MRQHFIRRNRIWRVNTPVIRALDWSPPDIKAEVLWEEKTLHSFFFNDKNIIQQLPSVYASKLFKD